LSIDIISASRRAAPSFPSSKPVLIEDAFLHDSQEAPFRVLETAQIPERVTVDEEEVRARSRGYDPCPAGLAEKFGRVTRGGPYDLGRRLDGRPDGEFSKLMFMHRPEEIRPVGKLDLFVI
jgi:hypothetical protein